MADKYFLSIMVFKHKTLTYASETWILIKKGRKQINIFEKKVYRRILGPVYESEKKIEEY
jgi:hypothetical protein